MTRQPSSRRVARLRDCRLDGLAVFGGLDAHPMAREVDLNAGLRVSLLDGFGDHADAVATGHGGESEFEHGRPLRC